jgi:hypothetical protein
MPAPTEILDLDGRLRVIFRPVDGPRGWLDGNHVQAELHDARAGEFGTPPYPVALAWVTLNDPVEGALRALPPMLDFVLVPDHVRRLGYATTLIRACERRWPDLLLTDAISEAGERLTEALDPTPWEPDNDADPARDGA